MIKFNISDIAGFFKPVSPAHKADIRRKIFKWVAPVAVVLGLIILYVLINNAIVVGLSDKALEQLIADDHDAAMANITKIRDAGVMLERFIIALLIIKISVVLAEIYFASRVINSLDTTVDRAKEIAGGDLRHEDIQISSRGELKKLGDALNIIKHGLTDLAVNVSGLSGKISPLSSSLLTASENIANDTKQQTDNIAKVSNAVETMSIIIHDVIRNTSKAAKSAKQASDLATTGGEVVTGTINGMYRISQ
ncbi:MAG: methyl-accepting chemotaxis protein, partial [Nitrospirae bacterium]|nr:methyl-accepting chemotaxis protein [Nitrospirota bacterium]